MSAFARREEIDESQTSQASNLFNQKTTSEYLSHLAVIVIGMTMEPNKTAKEKVPAKTHNC